MQYLDAFYEGLQSMTPMGVFLPWDEVVRISPQFEITIVVLTIFISISIPISIHVYTYIQNTYIYIYIHGDDDLQQQILVCCSTAILHQLWSVSSKHVAGFKAPLQAQPAYQCG